MFSTFNKDLNEEFFYNFDYSNQMQFEFNEDLYIPSGENKSMNDTLSLTEIKSTEEISQKNESSSLKNFAEDNELV